MQEVTDSKGNWEKCLWGGKYNKIKRGSKETKDDVTFKSLEIVVNKKARRCKRVPERKSAREETIRTYCVKKKS